MSAQLMKLKTGLFAALLAGALAVTASPANAAPGKKGHGHDQGHSEKTGGHGSDHSMPGGMPGKAADVSRTVLVIAKDTEFNLKKIQVKSGETIRFVIRNKGDLVHEFTVGTHEMQKDHQTEMMKMMDAGKLTADKVKGGMDHNHGNSVLVEPGKEGQVIWMFHKGATLEFGCNIPGHYEQGMKGEFVINGGA